MNTEFYVRELRNNASKLNVFLDDKSIDSIGKKIKVLFIEQYPDHLALFVKKFNGAFDLTVTETFCDAQKQLENTDFEYCVIDARDEEGLRFAENFDHLHEYCKFIIFSDEDLDYDEFNVLSKKELFHQSHSGFMSKLLFC